MADPTDRFLDTDMNEIRRRLGQDNEQRVIEVGESICDRSAYSTGIAQTSQGLTLTGFTARATQNISQIRVWTAGTAAGATPTLIRLGVYLRSGINYSLVASTPTDLTLLAAANTTYSKAFTAPFLKLAGEDYLVALLIVSAAAMPTMAAPSATNGSTAFLTDSALIQPIVSGKITGQADLPASFTSASVILGSGIFHALLLQ